jgi:hypothetical protein
VSSSIQRPPFPALADLSDPLRRTLHFNEDYGKIVIANLPVPAGKGRR